jgi:glutamate formiminotransferase / formiminotetrahydrofolate cyclodeaminase
MQTLVECVPNFSEGRDPRVVDAIVAAILAGPAVYLLRREMDFDHHRSVITFVGTRESVGEAALRGIGKAAELIDLNKHQGAHPRLGATDVVPFVPISSVTLKDCIHIAEWVAEEAWRRFQIPTYLYEAAARKPERVNLENIRRGQFEGVRDEIANNPHRHPDFGSAALHPTAGATVVGARKFLIAYNINLNTPDLAPAQSIAKKIRASSGGFPGVKAMAVDLKARKLAQVSMNFTDFETTSMAKVYEAVELEAAALGVQIVGSEIVGLVPRKALEAASVQLLRIENFRPELVVENCLEEVLAGREVNSDTEGRGQQESAALQSPLRAIVGPYVNLVAAATPTPGGGSAAALAGALAAALGEMVCGVSQKRKSLAAHHSALDAARLLFAATRDKLMTFVDLDPRSYETLMQALKLPQQTESERAGRDRAVEAAAKQATLAPLETAEIADQVFRLISSLGGITTPQAAADLSVALSLADTARRGGIENVLANIPKVHDSDWVKSTQSRLELLRKSTANG